MKKILIIILSALLLCAAFSGCASKVGEDEKTTASTTKAATEATTAATTAAENISEGEKKLRALLQKECADAIVDFAYLDYDNNGTEEAFAATSKAPDEDDQYVIADIWFIGENGVRKLRSDFRAGYVDTNNSVIKVLEANGEKLAVVAKWFQTGESSFIWYVKDGKCVYDDYASDKLLCFIRVNEEMGWIEGRHSAYDLSQNMGHTWKRYYFYIDNGLKEYKGTPISEAEIKKYKGADEILKQIKQAGKFKNAYKRENGIININYVDSDSLNRNATLLIKNNSVSLVEYEDYDESALKNSDQEGVYLASVLDSYK